MKPNTQKKEPKKSPVKPSPKQIMKPNTPNIETKKIPVTSALKHDKPTTNQKNRKK